MARRHAAIRSIAPLVLLMLLVVWPQVAAAQDQGQGQGPGQANGQNNSAAGSYQIFLPLASGGLGQAAPATSIWSDAAVPAGINGAQRWVVPDAFRLVSADMARLDAVLAQAPAENQAGVAASSAAGNSQTFFGCDSIRTTD